MKIIIYGSRYGTAKAYAETQAMIDTYDKKVSFVDFGTMADIEKAIIWFTLSKLCPMWYNKTDKFIKAEHKW